MKLKAIYEAIKPDPNRTDFPEFDYKKLQKWYKEQNSGRKLEDDFFYKMYLKNFKGDKKKAAEIYFNTYVLQDIINLEDYRETK